MKVLTVDQFTLTLDTTHRERFVTLAECIETCQCDDGDLIPVLDARATRDNMDMLFHMTIDSKYRCSVSHLCTLLMLAYYLGDDEGVQWLEYELYRLGQYALDIIFDEQPPLLSDDALHSLAQCFGVKDVDGPAQIWMVLGRNPVFDNTFSRTVQATVPPSEREVDLRLLCRDARQVIIQRKDSYGVLPCFFGINNWEVDNAATADLLTTGKWEAVSFTSLRSFALPWFDARVVCFTQCNVEYIPHTYPSTRVLKLHGSSVISTEALANAFSHIHSIALWSLSYLCHSDAFQKIPHLSRALLSIPNHRFHVAEWIVELFVSWVMDGGVVLVNADSKLRRIYTHCPLRVEGPGCEMVDIVQCTDIMDKFTYGTPLV